MTGEERELEESLAQLQPSAPSLLLEAIRLEAIQRRLRRSVWIWRVAATAMAACLALSLTYFHPSPKTLEKIVYLSAPGTSNPAPAPIVAKAPAAFQPLPDLPRYAARTTRTTELLELRDAVIERGIDALPPPHATSADDAPSPTARFRG